MPLNLDPPKREDFHYEKKCLEGRGIVLVGTERLKLLWKSKLALWDQTQQWHSWRSLCCPFDPQKYLTLILPTQGCGRAPSIEESWHCHCLPQHIFLESLAKRELCLVILSKQGWGSGELLWLCVLFLNIVVWRWAKERCVGSYRHWDINVLILRKSCLDPWRYAASPPCHKPALVCSFCPLIHESLE